MSELGKSSITSSPVNPSQTSTSSQTSASSQATLSKALSYAERKEQQKRISRAEKAVKESERKIEDMEKRMKELDALLMVPENASDMKLVTEYTSTKQCLDAEVEKWEQLSEELEIV